MTDTRADPKALQEKLRLLGVDYAEQLPGKIAQIQEIWKNLQTGWDQLACQTLHRMAHGLSGSGALFGFSAISKAARDLDCSLVDLAEGKTPATAVQRTNIQGLMEELSRAAALKQNFLPGKASSTGMGVSTAAKSHSSKLIFIVEDELDAAQELALQLGYFGYEVRVYHQLSVFRQAIEQNPQAIVLMDISFPENGRGGCKTMQEVQQHQVTPIRVMLSSSVIAGASVAGESAFPHALAILGGRASSAAMKACHSGQDEMSLAWRLSTLV